MCYSGIVDLAEIIPQVVLPPQFIATKYPGYFWNDQTKKLYSVKVSGTLKPLKCQKPNKWNHFDQIGYNVSVEGRKRFLMLDYLMLLERQHSLFPVFERT